MAPRTETVQQHTVAELCTAVKKYCRAGQSLEPWELAECLRLRGGLHKFVEATGKMLLQNVSGGAVLLQFSSDCTSVKTKETYFTGGSPHHGRAVHKLPTLWTSATNLQGRRPGPNTQKRIQGPASELPPHMPHEHGVEAFQQGP
eukprot:1840033-Amphidinium_carterae.1